MAGSSACMHADPAAARAQSMMQCPTGDQRSGVPKSDVEPESHCLNEAPISGR
jgi:hypothetical protein